MQVAIHTCEACGTRLQVLERFLGQTVRCTNCGQEFVARAPARSDSPPGRREAVVAACPGCGTRLKVSAQNLDRKLRCPRCRHVFVVASRGGAAVLDHGDVGRAPVAPEQGPPSSPGESAHPKPGPPPEPAAGSPQATSYSHVCTACGAAMQVHARYFGRILRCTSCRTEFEARPPTTGEARGTVSDRMSVVLDREPIALEERAQRRRWIAVVLVLGAFIGATLWWLGSDRRQGFARELFTVTKSRTELGVLQRGDQPTVIAALDREALAEMIVALRAGDEAGFERLRSSSRCIEIAAGTRVRVLERRKRAVEASVRVLDGPWASRIVWVPIDWVR